MSRALASLLAALAATLCLVALGIGQPPSADVVLVNGRVFTSDGSRPFVEALAIRGDRIVAVGTSAEMESLAGPETPPHHLGAPVRNPRINAAPHHFCAPPPRLS